MDGMGKDRNFLPLKMMVGPRILLELLDPKWPSLWVYLGNLKRPCWPIKVVFLAGNPRETVSFHWMF